MKGRELSDGDIRNIIEAYIKYEGNKVHVQEAIGTGYSTVNRYVKLWQAGRLKVEGLPEPRSFGLAHEVRDAPTVKKLRDDYAAVRVRGMRCNGRLRSYGKHYRG